MSLLTPPFLQNLWRTAFSLRQMIMSFIRPSRSAQFVVPEDVATKPNGLALPFCRRSIETRTNTQLREFSNASVLVANTSSDHHKNLLTVNKKPSSWCVQPSSLRIFKEYDQDVEPHCAGRMVISGRMNDVCAEIDRLVKSSGLEHCVLPAV